MRLRRAVLKIPAKSSVSPRSLLYKLCPLLTPSESTLPQLLIPLHFKSFISNTYEKTRRGPLRPASKFGNSSLPPHHSSTRAAVLVYFDLRPRGATDRATAHPQVLSLPLLQAASSLSPVFATLTKNTGGWGILRATAFPVPSRHRSPNLSSRGRRPLPVPPRHRSPICHPEGIEGSAFLFGPHGSRALLTAHYSLPPHRATVLKNG